MVHGELFDFDYKWEIYTPAAQRKYGFYVLPILYGERFIGRILRHDAPETILFMSVKKLLFPRFYRWETA